MKITRVENIIIRTNILTINNYMD